MSLLPVAPLRRTPSDRSRKAEERERAHERPDTGCRRLRSKATRASRQCVRERSQGLLTITVSVRVRPRGVRSCTRSEDYSGPSRVSGSLQASPAGVSGLRYGRRAWTRCSTISTRASARPSPSTAAPLAILAPAGSGKTRVLTRRIAWRVREELAEPRHVLAVTFTRKAAGELIAPARARSASDAASRPGTFHALALAQLRRRAAEQGREARRVLGSKARSWAARSARGRGRSALVGRRRGRDRVGQGPHGRARRATPTPPRPRPGATPPRPRRDRRRSTRATSARSASGAPSTSTTCSWRAPTRSRRDADVRRRASAGGSATCSSTSSRTRRRCSSGCCAPGSATAPTCASSATSPRRSTGSPAPTPRRSRDVRRRTSPAATVVALDRNYRSTPQVVAVAESVLGPAAGVDASRAVQSVRPDGPAPTVTAYADDAAEAAGGRAGLLGGVRRRRALVGDGRAVPHQRAVGALRGRVRAARRPVPDDGHGALRRSTRGQAAPRRAARGRPRRGPAPTVRRAPRRSRRGTGRGTRPPNRPAPNHDARRNCASTATRSLALGREYLAVETAPATLGRLRGVARRQRPAADATPRAGRRPPHVPPRQGPRVARRVRHRARTGAGARSRWAPDECRARRGAPLAPRRARPRCRRACTVVGPATRTVAGRTRPSRAEPVADR